MVGAMQALLLAYSSLPTWYARRWPAAPNHRASQLLIGTSCMLLGFETGYNLTAPRTFDPFAKWATIHLIAHSLCINDWCQKNTSKVFGNGIVALARRLRE